MARGLRISFRPASGVEEELRELVAVENECCSWAGWRVETDAELIVLDVRASREGIAVLHGMFKRQRNFRSSSATARTDEFTGPSRSKVQTTEKGERDGQAGGYRVRLDRRGVRGSGRSRGLRARRLDLRVRPRGRRQQIQARRGDGGRGPAARARDLRGLRG